MSEQAARFLKRHQIDTTDLEYLYHQGKQTVLCMTDGREISTLLPLRDLHAELPDGAFWSIQKGVVVSARYVLTVDDEGVYTMVSGRRFQGRRRNLAEHKRRRRELELSAASGKPVQPADLLEKCTLLEDAPIAFCVIELVFAENGRGVDFIFRYCNKRMADVEGVPVSDMLNRSFYEVFSNGDRKWIVPYADVALNGVQRELRDYSPEVDKNLIISCFQPQPGYYACFLVVDHSA